MSNQISYEEAIMQLVEMFPKIDIEVIKDLLLENHRNMERTIASLLIISGDESPELVKTVKKGTEFVVSDETEDDLKAIERQYGLDLHKTWHTRVPHDLLMFNYAKQHPESETQSLSHNGIPNRYTSPYMYGPGIIYNNPGDIFGPSMGLSEFGRSLKDKFRHYLNKRKGYQLTQTTEDYCCLLNKHITFPLHHNTLHMSIHTTSMCEEENNVNDDPKL